MKEKNKSRDLLRLLALLIFGISIGFLISSFLSLSPNNITIEYISQEEILQLEKARVKSVNATDLFFGRSADAIEYIEELAKQRQRRGAKVVFATEGIISGNNVISISKEIYQLVIQRLEAEDSNYAGLRRSNELVQPPMAKKKSMGSK
jgi:hypothetical protein